MLRYEINIKEQYILNEDRSRDVFNDDARLSMLQPLRFNVCHASTQSTHAKPNLENLHNLQRDKVYQ